MAIGGPFRELGGFLDACERAACSVNRVQVTEAAEPGDGVPIAADVELLLEPSRSESDTGCSLSSPRIDPDGTVRFALETTREIVPTSEYDVDVELLSARIDASGGGTLALCVQPVATGGDTAAGESSVPSARGPSHGDTDRRNGHDRSTNSVPTATSPNDESTTERESDRDLPPFQDPELLAEVYESSETFAEMADAIDMDVTAETVRRYMIDFDIHQPNSYRTGETGEQAPDEYAESEGEVAGGETGSGTGEGTDAGTDDEVAPRGEPTARGAGTDGAESAGGVGTNADETRSEPVVLSDGLGLPDDVTADTLIETVKRSNTIYEVTQDIDLDRQDAFEMLHDLNLVDLVMGRLATEAEREITREEIVDRLREASATQ